MSLRGKPQSSSLDQPKFPVIFPVNGNFAAETGSHLTASSARFIYIADRGELQSERWIARTKQEGAAAQRCGALEKKPRLESGHTSTGIGGSNLTLSSRQSADQRIVL